MPTPFDINAIWKRLLPEYYQVFGVAIPKFIKNEIRKHPPIIWKKDDQAAFQAIMIMLFPNLTFECPSCEKTGEFLPDRSLLKKRLEKRQRFMTHDNRTYGCPHCSFVFNPLAWTRHGHVKIDLRYHLFYMYLSSQYSQEVIYGGHENHINWPIQSLAYILGVAPATAERIKYVNSPHYDNLQRFEEILEKPKYQTDEPNLRIEALLRLVCAQINYTGSPSNCHYKVTTATSITDPL